MYSSFSYRRDSKRLNHKGRIIRTKSDYVVPDVEIVNAQLLNKYKKILQKAGEWPVIPPPDTVTSHDEDFEFTTTVVGNSLVINNLDQLALLMSAYCGSDNHRYCFFPFGLQFNKTGAGQYNANFQFQTGDSANNKLYVVGATSSSTGKSSVVCAWFIYDFTLERYYIWFTGFEGESTATFNVIVDDYDTNAGSAYEVQKIYDNFHPIFAIADISTATIGVNNYSNITCSFVQQPSRTHKIYTSGILDDPSRI